MKRAMVCVRIVLMSVVCLGTVAVVSPASGAKNRCKDRCNDRYRIRKDVCRAIPLKYERKSCERAAKRAKDDCKHSCRSTSVRAANALPSEPRTIASIAAGDKRGVSMIRQQDSCEACASPRSGRCENAQHFSAG